jgi:hypothetical protein
VAGKVASRVPELERQKRATHFVSSMIFAGRKEKSCDALREAKTRCARFVRKN